MMMDALKTLSGRDHIQIIITTHSPYLVKQLEYAQLRLVEDNAGVKTISQVDTASMPYVSLNEVNYLAFGEASEEYHDELYGHLQSRGDLKSYFKTQPTQTYNKINRQGNVLQEQICKTEIIRHQIHHPENPHNARYTHAELKQSIDLMRQYLINNP